MREFETKYYWILVECETFSGKHLHDYTSKEHPFIFIKGLYNPFLQEERIQLIDWKEISKEEYELY